MSGDSREACLAFLAASAGYASIDESTTCLLCSKASTTNGHRFVRFADLKRIAELCAELRGMEQSEASASCFRVLRESFAFCEESVRDALTGTDPSLSGAADFIFGAAEKRRAPTRGLAICWKDCPLSQAVYYALAGRSPHASSSSGDLDVGYFHFDPDRYEERLLEKVERVRDLLNRSWAGQWPAIECVKANASPKTNYRHRNRLGVSVSDEGLVRWMIWDETGWPSQEVNGSSFPVPSTPVCSLLAPLARGLQAGGPSLLEGLQAAHFLSTTVGHVGVQLIYSSPGQEDAWRDAATRLRDAAMRDAPVVTQLSLARRSKKQKLLVGSDEVEERLLLADGREVCYVQVADSFSNPNAAINTAVLDHLCSLSRSIAASGAKMLLLELYCGCGNHTAALAPLFAEVVGVEISRALVAAAQRNLLLNGAEGACVLACDARKFTDKVLRRGGFYGSKGSGGDRFDCLLVDPPRAGLDDRTRRCLPLFDHVLYVSCDPASLARDLACATLAASHELVSAQCFDAFCYTPHVETVVYLRRRTLTN